MGFNTALMVLNDRIHEIRDDPKIGQHIFDLVTESYSPSFHENARSGLPIRVGDRTVGLHGKGISCLSSVHADYMQVVAIGGNSMRPLGYGGGYRAEPEEMLRNLADTLGYRLVKK